MSYSLMTQCQTCEKSDECTDSEHIQKGIDKIHENCLEENGHLGSGTVIIQCFRQRSTC